MLLSIDTCGAVGTVALARRKDEGVEALALTGIAGKTYSARLAPTIREVLAAQGARVSELVTIVVTNGPGGFTGIRIGLATAKGLAELHGTPVIAVSRLAVLAHKAGKRAAALDASRGEFYVGEYGTDLSTGASERLLTRDHFLQLSSTLGGDLTVCETGAQALAPAATLVPPPTAMDALEYALPRVRAGAFDEAMTLDGNYLRKSDAEIFAPHGRG
ncbi:MAG TPA: tRNA (adenosine(37)-N6)-threonylcarbamoyltransferase complex dimerization subunit type 1 TsaB [Acidobacteriaceae bacterium]|nr:tRNA (adenosine(37)-N6)-threonylcarbamoyltransferase complex dimerization subunit type 1 TsaB [Acidobacteriaceae bacterium]